MNQNHAGHSPSMTDFIPFSRARQIIAAVASERSIAFTQHEEVLPLHQAVGRTAKNDIRSPINTPTFDSAAMDGFAVISAQTTHARPDAPLRLLVKGTMRAGDNPLVIDDAVRNGFVPCVEIMTGAAFPIARSTGRHFDACIPRDRTTVWRDGAGTLVEIVNPPLTSWHKRLTGGDFRQGDMLIEHGTLVAPKHVMALASVGVNTVTVTRTVRAAVLSTGSELIPAGAKGLQAHQYKIPDANGPYLAAALTEMGAEAEYLGAMPDDADIVTQCLGDQLQAGSYDLIISTGGVSAGQVDCMPECIARLGGHIHFRHVAMKPGHPTLFASLPLDGVKIEHSSPNKHMRGQGFQDAAQSRGQAQMVAPAIFCLPGNPVASAACFRFLTTPYIRTLSGMSEEHEMAALVAITPEAAKVNHSKQDGSFVVEGSVHFDVFRQAVIRSNEKGATVEVSKERSPAKTNPFASSNCWVHVPRGDNGVRQGDVVSVYPFCSPKS